MSQHRSHDLLHSFSFLMRVFMALALCLVMTMVAATKAEDQKPKTPAGDITIEARWPDDANADIDLWVRAPEDRAAVGYSRRSDKQTSYLRDDIGTSNDSGSANFEFAFCRGLSPGAYAINLHVYAGRGSLPVTVRVKVSLTPANGGSEEVATRDVILSNEGQETTAILFEIDSTGKVVVVNTDPPFVALRSPGAAI